MTNDNIETRRQYHRLYCNWPEHVIILHIMAIDAEVNKMHPDEMIEARALMDMKLPQWK